MKTVIVLRDGRSYVVDQPAAVIRQGMRNAPASPRAYDNALTGKLVDIIPAEIQCATAVPS